MQTFIAVSIDFNDYYMETQNLNERTTNSPGFFLIHVKISRGEEIEYF